MFRPINPIRDYDAYRQIKKIIQEFKPDIVHTHAAKAGALGRIAATECKVPVVLHTFHGHVFHSYFNPVATSIFLNIERFLVNRCTHIIAISEIQKGEFVNRHKLAPAEKIVTLPIGLELERFSSDLENKRKQFREKYNVKDDEVAIGIIARLAPIKNHSHFLQAIAELRKHTDQAFRVFVVGGGETLEEMVELADGLKLFEKTDSGEPIIKFTSWIKDIDVVNAGLDVVCLSSLNEGTPVSLIEAQAAKRAVLSTDVGGVRDAVIDGETGFVVPKDDMDSYIKQLKKLVEDPDLRKQFGNVGQTFVQGKYSLDIFIENQKKLYKKLLVEKGINNR